MAGDPGIECGRGLFEQSEFLYACVTRRFYSKLARFFIKAGGHGVHDFLPSQRCLPGVLPGFAQMSQVARGGFDRR